MGFDFWFHSSDDMVEKPFLFRKSERYFCVASFPTMHENRFDDHLNDSYLGGSGKSRGRLLRSSWIILVMSTDSRCVISRDLPFVITTSSAFLDTSAYGSGILNLSCGVRGLCPVGRGWSWSSSMEMSSLPLLSPDVFGVDVLDDSTLR